MIYLHLGLHKTATTSLQSSIFESLSGVRFIGRRDIPYKMQSQLYKDILDYCMCGDDEKYSAVREELTKYSLESATEDFLLSDEWFTAGYAYPCGFSGTEWQERIRRLALLVRGFDVKVFVVVRLPSAGILSQYQQLQTVGIADKFLSYNDYIHRSTDIDAWDVDYLRSQLTALFKSVTILDFEDIIDSEASGEKLSDIFERDVPSLTVVTNSKSFDRSTEYLTRTSFANWLTDFLPLSFHRNLRKLLKVNFFKRLWHVLSTSLVRVEKNRYSKDTETRMRLEKLDNSYKSLRN